MKTYVLKFNSQAKLEKKVKEVFGETATIVNGRVFVNDKVLPLSIAYTGQIGPRTWMFQYR